MNKGSMLLELLLALALSMLVLVAVVQITTQSIAGSGLSKAKSEASSYATKVIEGIRQQRNNQDWGVFNSVSCSDWGIYSCGATLTNVDSKTKKVVVVVSWQDKINHSVTQTVIFTKY